ncbi:MAG: AbrB/MazE/SpoVT family DNA-binding domain-containing protein [Nitrososphaeria archaeon]|nr:AbrB/MazE/SpoVT family DNA-binding domain-containing protein [Nitrososphaeria archaeon]
MEEFVVVDKQGRIVLPSNIRKAFGLKGGDKLSIKLNESKIILEPYTEELDKKVQTWVEFASNTNAEAFTEKVRGSWKWFSLEYAKRKIGL